MIPTLFENEDILAVNKPEGLASIPERNKKKENLYALLTARYSEKLFIVHRLDKEVSGVILFAKHAKAHKMLNEQFSQRQIHKTYLAASHGVVKAKCGTIDKPLRQYGSGRMGVDGKRGKLSLTKFQVLKRFDAYTLLQVYPVTGRRHQIRVHLYSLGHPIVGDIRYGDKHIQNRYARLMLHAHQISFRLLSGQKMKLEASLPISFEKVLSSLQGEQQSLK